MSTATAPLRRLDPGQLRALRDEGWVIVRDLVPRAPLARLHDRCAAVGDAIVGRLRDDGAPVDDATGEPPERRLAVATRRCRGELHRFGRSWRGEIAPDVHAVQSAPALVEAIASIIGDAVYGHVVFNSRPKLPGQQLTTVPWHQDAAYFGPEAARLRIITAWLPLVPVDERNGCLQVASRTHRSGLAPHRVEDAEGRFLEIVGEPPPNAVVSCAMQPGDALLFDQWLWHRSLTNESDAVRWSVDLRYLDAPDPTGFAGLPRPWTLRHPSEPPLTDAEWQASSARLR